MDFESVLAKCFPTKSGCLFQNDGTPPMPGKRPLSTFHSMRYRMHTSISSFPSKHFYNDRLENVENLVLLNAAKSVFPRPNQRVVWIDCDSPHQLGRVIQVGSSSRLPHLAKCFFFFVTISSSWTSRLCCLGELPWQPKHSRKSQRDGLGEQYIIGEPR